MAGNRKSTRQKSQKHSNTSTQEDRIKLANNIRDNPETSTVLVVDDEKSVRITTRTILEEENYNVLEASSGKEMLSILKESMQIIDVILLDIMMPELNGFEVLEIIKNDPEMADIGVIMLSALSESKDKVQAFTLGASDYVEKPFSCEELIARVEVLTKAKRAERALRESEERYRLLAENVTDIIWTMDMNGQYTYISPSITRQTGWMVDEYLALGITEIIAPESLKIALGEYEEQLTIDKSKEEDTSIVVTIDLEVFCKDGSTIWTETNLSILRDTRGNAIGIHGVTRNITERREAEKQKLLAEEKYRTIFESSAVAITVTDENENIISWNHAAEVLLGMDNDDLYMRPVSTLYSNAEWNRIRSQSVREKGAQNHIETRIINKNKQLVDVDLSVKVLKDSDGQVTGAIGVLTDIRDVGEFKKMEEKYEELVAAYRKQSLLLEEAGITIPEDPDSSEGTELNDDFLF